MATFRSFRRVRKLIQITHRYRLLEILNTKPLLKAGLGLTARIVAPFTKRCDKTLPLGERLCLALTDLGPIYIKFGQLLSTRRDLLPLDVAIALAKLQDDVQPFSGTEAKAITESALGERLDEHFEYFNTEPMASASIAQVHAGRLKTGEEVILKVLRPNIEIVIQKDLALLKTIANWVHDNVEQSERFKPREVVADYERTILNELNLMHEVNNAERLANYWQGSPILYVPKVYPELSHEQVMVMERIYGVPIMDLETLHKANTNMELLAERGVEIFFTQVFRDSFFHADMHPGNIFVDITNPQDPKYMAIDFGIMGSLQKDDQRYLAENFIAFFNRDYYQVAKLHVDSGWVPPSTKVEEFQVAIEEVCEPIFGKPLSEISFGHLLINLFQTAQRFNMPVQPQLVLLQKTLLYIEGLGRELYPELDLWKTAKPYLENWLLERMSVKTLFDEIQSKAPFWREKIPEIPDLVYQTLKQQQQMQSLMLQQTELLARQNKQHSRRSKSQFYGILGAALFIGSCVLYTQDGQWQAPETMTALASVIAFIFSRSFQDK